jgi:hypothetical protein
MRAAQWLGRVLGWVPTALLAAVLLGVVIAATSRLIDVPVVDFILSIAETVALAWLLVGAWTRQRRELAARGAHKPVPARHPRVREVPSRISQRERTSARLRALAFAASLAIVLTVLYLVRPLPILHGPLWVIAKYPLVWLVVILVSAAVGALVRRVDRTVTRGVFAIWLVGSALVALLPMAWLAPKLSAAATYRHYRYVQIARLPSGGEVRVLPREVAEKVATIGYNLSGHTLGRGHMILDPRSHRLTWSFDQAPNGLRNVFLRYSEGIALLDAQETSRRYRQIDRRFHVAPSMQISDNTSWKIYKNDYFSVPTDAVPVVDVHGEPEFVIPALSYQGLLVKFPVVSKVYVFHPDGRIERLSVASARTRPDIVATGRIVPEGLAREIQDAYAYKHGLWNTSIGHNDQTQIVDSSDSDNHQPYLMAFSQTAQGDPLPAGEKERLYWVSSAEPRGHAFATKAIFLTDALTAVTYVWSLPPSTSLTGADQAVQDAKSLAIPGIVFATTAEASLAGAGRYQVVEPRPVFVKGRLQYLLSIIPTSHNNVTKSVIVDAASNKVVALFNHDTDPDADRKLTAYLRTGALDASSVASPQDVGQPGQPGTTETTTAPTPAAGTLAQLLAQNAQLLEQVRRNQARIEELLQQAREKKPTG